MRLYQQLQYEERFVIQKMKYSGKTDKEISVTINRDISTIYREVERNRTHGYHAKEAHTEFLKRKKLKKRKLDTNGLLRLIVCTFLMNGDSPELISHYLKMMFPGDSSMNLSHESIYQWIYAQKEKKGECFFNQFLFTKQKKRQNRSNTYKSRGKDTTKKSIHDRPAEANDKSEIGHLEGDLIVSSGNDSYLLTLVERKSVFTWGIKLPSKDAETVTRGITEALGNLPVGFVKTITFDNGSEFCMHQTIENAIQCKVYFADPYSSWQRGLNEHINGRIRYYLPKKKSFAHLTDEFIDDSLFSINARPRKSRGWVSPADILNSHLVALHP
jgi:transposase, IS30 family